jgi:plasmid stabilization system protein ParE
MSRDVFLTQKAERQLHAAADWYAEKNPKVADDWFNGVVTAMDSLATKAEQFPLARENDEFPFALREMLYGLGKRKTHRVLFVIRPDKVVVHQVRHVAQRNMTTDND